MTSWKRRSRTMRGSTIWRVGGGVISLTMSSSIYILLIAKLVSLSVGFVLIGFSSAAKHYEVGHVYTYDYVLKMEMAEPPSGGLSSSSGGSTVGYKIMSQVVVKPVWQSETETGEALLEIQLVGPHLQIKSAKAPEPEGFRDHTSNLESLRSLPLFVSWGGGRVVHAYSVQGDDASLVNVKKGIANLLQVHQQSGNDTTEEESPAGRCAVKYTVVDGFHLTKTVKDCNSQSQQGQARTNRALGSDVESTIYATVSLTRDSGVVGEVQVSESHVVRVNAKTDVGASVFGSQSLKLVSSNGADSTGSSGGAYGKMAKVDLVIREIERRRGLTLLKGGLQPTVEDKGESCVPNCKSTQTLANFLTPDNMASTRMASAFIQLVSKLRDCSSLEKELTPLLNPTFAFFPQVLDACAASGRPDIHSVVMKVLNFPQIMDDEIENQERYLLGLSLSSSPPPEVLQDLFKLVKKGLITSPKLQESLLLSTCALAHTLSQKNPGHLVDEVEDHVLNSLLSCESPSCQAVYLRCLKNLKAPRSLPTLFEVLLSPSTDKKTGVVTMKSIHAMPDSFITQDQRQSLLKSVICQIGPKKRFDSSTRTLAIDVVLRSRSVSLEDVRLLLSFFLRPRSGDKEHAEVATFLVNRLEEFSEDNPNLAFWRDAIIKQEGFHTYFHLAPKGLSTSFSRPFGTSNASFSNAIEMSGKILKRSLFDVHLGSPRVQLLSLGIFADGLASFAEEAEAEVSQDVEEEEVDATAGMELSLLDGVASRPLVFFVGKGELMGLVWSGAGSERTSAIRGNVLLQDTRTLIHLYNGLVAEASVLGGLSFDLAGQVAVSLWHRTANSLVENKAGLYLQSVVRADTSFVKSRVEVTTASEASLHFTSDINFYQGFIMCLKLTQPEFTIRQTIRKTERIPGSKHKLRKAKYRTIPVPGVTYALNKKNSELCTEMYGGKKDEL